jgi:hypothetical protein
MAADRADWELHTKLSSLKERAGVKGVWPAVLWPFWLCEAWRHGLTTGFP